MQSMRSFILVFMLLLAACGTPTTSTPPTSQTAAQGAYPTPSIVSATMTPPMPVAPSQVVSPTVVVATRPLTITNIQSFPVRNEPLSIDDLIGWSPDDSFFLFTRIDRYDPPTQYTIGKIQTIDTTTGISNPLLDQEVIVGMVFNGTGYPINQPEWNESCCEVIASSLDGEQQSINRIDTKTNTIKQIKNIKPSMVKYHANKLYTIDNGQLLIDGVTPHTSLTYALTSTLITRHGIYTVQPNLEIQYRVHNGAVWQINAEKFLGKEWRKFHISQMASSADDRWLAVTLEKNSSWYRELWVIDRETNQAELIAANEKISYPSWSADSSILSYRVDESVFLVNRKPNQHSMIFLEGNTPVWHHTKPWFAMLSEDATAIDVFEVRR